MNIWIQHFFYLKDFVVAVVFFWLKSYDTLLRINDICKVEVHVIVYFGTNVFKFALKIIILPN